MVAGVVVGAVGVVVGAVAGVGVVSVVRFSWLWPGSASCSRVFCSVSLRFVSHCAPVFLRVLSFLLPVSLCLLLFPYSVLCPWCFLSYGLRRLDQGGGCRRRFVSRSCLSSLLSLGNVFSLFLL